MTFLTERWLRTVSRKTEEKKSYSCIWLERDLWLIGGRYEMDKCHCRARWSLLRDIWAVIWEKRHPSLMSFPRRRQATMKAFYSVGQLWYESRVSWRLKRCFFISRVVNTALSGIEASCPSKAQYQALTSLVTCLARRVMAGAAARRGEQGSIRTMTNKEVLRFWKLAPCDVEARVRRLK